MCYSNTFTEAESTLDLVARLELRTLFRQSALCAAQQQEVVVWLVKVALPAFRLPTRALHSRHVRSTALTSGAPASSSLNINDYRS